MNFEATVIVGLVIGNVAQFIYWSGYVMKLTDRIMSGSFAAYKSAKTIGQPKFEDQKQQEVQQNFGLMEDFNI